MVSSTLLGKYEKIMLEIKSREIFRMNLKKLTLEIHWRMDILKNKNASRTEEYSFLQAYVNINFWECTP